MTDRFPGFRPLAAAVIAAILSTGAAAQSAGDGVSATAQFMPGFSGAYLAARHAATRGDVDAAGSHFAKALARDPSNAALMEQTLLYQTAAGRVLAAVPIARHLVEYQADHRMANLLLTVDDIAAGRLDEASARINDRPEAFHPLVGALLGAWADHGRGLEGDPMKGLQDQAIFRIFAEYHRGLMTSANGDLEASKTAFEAAIKELRAPTGRMARAFGAVLRRQGDDEAARKLYDEAIGVSVGDAMLEAEIASLEAGEEAQLLVSDAAEGAAEALYGLASALAQDDDFRLSLSYTRLASFLRPDLADATLLAAELFESQKQYNLAVAAYEAVPPESPLFRSSEIGRAEALYQLDEIAKATEALTTLTRREPEAVDAQLALGDLMRRTEQWPEGAAAYDAAIQLMAAKGRENWVLFYERGICYERNGQWELAEADFFKALELREDQPLVLNYLGYSWLDLGMEHRYEEALELIAKAVEQRPEDGYIVDSLGWGYYLTGDYPAAVRELERAIELRPVDPVINDHLGDALWKVGRKLEAEFQWKRALSFDPEEKDLKRIVRKLEVGLDVVLKEEAAEKDGPAEAANDGG